MGPSGRCRFLWTWALSFSSSSSHVDPHMTDGMFSFLSPFEARWARLIVTRSGSTTRSTASLQVCLDAWLAVGLPCLVPQYKYGF